MSAGQPVPAATRKTKNAAAELPERPTADPAPAPAPTPAPAPAPIQAEATVIHNVRIPASLKRRVRRAVSQLRLDEDDMAISETSLTIEALTTYLDSKGM